jgi:hypothetical protein
LQWLPTPIVLSVLPASRLVVKNGLRDGLGTEMTLCHAPELLFCLIVTKWRDAVISVRQRLAGVQYQVDDDLFDPLRGADPGKILGAHVATVG